MLALGIAVAIWGFSFALAKMSLSSLSPFELVTVRLFLGFLTGIILTRVFDSNSFWSNSFRKQWRLALIIGAFEFAGTYLLYTWSLKFLPSGVVGTLTLMTPVLAYFLGIISRVDLLSGRAVLAMALSLIGGALSLPLNLIFGNFDLNNTALWGAGLIMASNFSFAIGNVLITKLNQNRRWNNSFTFQGQGLGALFAFLVLMFVSQGQSSLWDSQNFNFQFWFLPLYLGIGATGVGFFLWNRGVQQVASTKATLVGNFKGPVSILFGTVMLDETISVNLIVGLALLLISVSILPKIQKI